MTAGDLHDVLAQCGASLMVRALAEIEHGRLAGVPQAAAGATYAAKIGKGGTMIDFSRPAQEVHNRVRGLSPVPGAWFEMAAGHHGAAERIRVLRTQIVNGAGPAGTVLDGALAVACGEGAVRLMEIQRAGKRPMSAAEFLRGYPIAPGMRLSGPH